MAKSKRKPSKAQRDKYNIAVAKQLKESGVLSKQAKLHSGSYISKEVLRKVKEYENIARLNYGAVKVSKEVARAAKERGYTVVQGNKIVGPKTPAFRNRLKSGAITGVKPVKGGYMEEVSLPHTVFDLHSLVEQLDGGIDSLKLPNEQFAFKYKGSESYRSFMDSRDLLQYLQHYKGIADLSVSRKPEDLQEEYESLTIFRLHPSDIRRSLPGVEERKKRRIKERAEKIAKGEYVTRKSKTQKSRAERLANLPDWKVKKILQSSYEYDLKKREKIYSDPVAREKYRQAAKERMKRNRNK